MLIRVVEGTHYLKLAFEYLIFDALDLLLKQDLFLHCTLHPLHFGTGLLDLFLHPWYAFILFVLYLASKLLIFLHQTVFCLYLLSYSLVFLLQLINLVAFLVLSVCAGALSLIGFGRQVSARDHCVRAVDCRLSQHLGPHQVLDVDCLSWWVADRIQGHFLFNGSWKENGQSGIGVRTFLKRQIIFFRAFIAFVQVGCYIKMYLSDLLIPFLSIKNDFEFCLNDERDTTFDLKVLVDTSWTMLQEIYKLSEKVEAQLERGTFVDWAIFKPI